MKTLKLNDTLSSLIGKAVVVTTGAQNRGVFFGYLQSISDDHSEVILKNARMSVYWSQKVHGVLGLAATGPLPDCRTSPCIPLIYLNEVSAIMAVTEQAKASWEEGWWDNEKLL
jgi:hypothetical protein